MFLPDRLKQWKPSTNHTTRCHVCVSGPHRKSALFKVMEGPMSWHFCSHECAEAWQEYRHDADVVAWLKIAKGVRALILEGREHELSRQAASEGRRALAGLRDGPRMALSVCQDSQLPPVTVHP